MGACYDAPTLSRRSRAAVHITMLRQFTVRSAAALLACAMMIVVAGCGIKGPLRAAPKTTTAPPPPPIDNPATPPATTSPALPPPSAPPAERRP
jgi:predicted small lipoprotein YifL